ncbi:winged helix-turn-helix domain-containing protein [Niveispirillum sp.]|uniref:response regulator transcription factor n=1 Tax=Niveispirillum sp. TaxID=1917217 RepID=UPI001B7173D2|nr:winged helix-turn-helix domain-containing protein [Niveispirillum sp.]MBP7334531.1 response regulator transcription factor [Niveispirillum sp.]
MDTAPKRILLIEPDETLRQTLAEQLAAQQSLCPFPAATGEEALANLALHGADGALLDATLAVDGLIPALRAGGLAGPLLLLLPAGMGLPAGADDHLAKPIRLGTLLARLKALLRRADALSAATAGEVLSIGPYRFLPAAKRLEAADGTRIRLTEKETQILDHLCRRGGTAPREDLLGAVWGYGAGIDTHTLETHIYRLRRKLAVGQPLLMRVDGGYRLAMEPVLA